MHHLHGRQREAAPSMTVSGGQNYLDPDGCGVAGISEVHAFIGPSVAGPMNSRVAEDVLKIERSGISQVR